MQDKLEKVINSGKNTQKFFTPTKVLKVKSKNAIIQLHIEG